MSLLSFPGGLIIPFMPDFANSAPGFVNSTLNDGVDRVAFIIRVPKTGTLDWFECRQGTQAVAPTNGIRFSFQDTDGSGDPDGTEDQWADVTAGLGAGNWLVPPNVMTNTGAAGGTKRSVTLGDVLCCVVSLPTFVAGSLTMSQLDLQNAQYSPSLVQYCDIKAAAFSKNFNSLAIALKYSTGYEIIAPNVYPAKTFTTTTLNSGTAGTDEIALRFQLTANAYVSGCIFRVDLDGPMDVNLYSGTSVIAGPASLLSANRAGTTAGYAYVKFASTLLTANTVYRIGLKPTSVTNISLYDFTVDSAGLMAAAPGGVEWYYSSRVDAGAWSDTTTRRPWAAIVLDGVDSIPLGAEVASVF